MGLPVKDLALLEPKRDLLLGILNRVRSVTDVATDLNAEITADGAGGRLKGVGSTEHLTSSGNGLLALPNHGNDGSAEHVIAKLGEEGLVHEVAVVLLEKFLAGHASLHGGHLVTLRLESGDDVTNNTTLNTIGLDLLCIIKTGNENITLEEYVVIATVHHDSLFTRSRKDSIGSIDVL